MQKLHRLIVLLSIISALLWAGGLILFIRYIPTTTIPATSVDAIIVLTGGTMRLNEGIHLLKQDYAPKMLITGVSDGVTLRELFETREEPWLEDKALHQRITIGYIARSTWQNAQEAREWIQHQNIQRILLVTSNYHLPRAHLEFRAAMPTLEIIDYPVIPEQVKLEKWWQHSGSRRLILSEYHKFLGVCVRVFFEKNTQ